MKGPNGRRTAGAGGDGCVLRRCAARGFFIVGLLLVVAGTALAYSEWQAQAEVPQAFGPDLPTRALRVDAMAGGADEPELPAEGAAILPPMEIAPHLALPDRRHALLIPLVRREGTSPAAADVDDPPELAAPIPHTPSWVDSTYSQAPAGGVTPGAARRETAPSSPSAQPTVGGQLPIGAYPSPIASGPDPIATPTPLPTPYPSARSAPTRIQIPAINLDAPVVSVGWREVEHQGRMVRVWNVADYAAGWHEASALPGQPGNVVISGHNNIRGEVFRDVADLGAGAEVTLTADGRPYEYVVESKMIFPERGRSIEERLENNRWIGDFEDERLTLVTCWPYTSNTHRVIVIARPSL